MIRRLRLLLLTLLLACAAAAQPQWVRSVELLDAPKPDYPAAAKQARITGAVRVLVTVGKDGAVKAVKPLSGHPLLVPAAVEAVRRWKIKPVVIQGQPAEVFAELELAFNEAQAPASEREPGLYATFLTSAGQITARLFEKEAPETVKNFAGLACGAKEWTDPDTREKPKRPLYNGTIFHRVIPGFMIQGGDPQGSGTGGPGYSFADEIHASLKFDQPGRLAMANTGPNTNGSQFFITEAPAMHLDGKHTIFGQVVEGMQIVKQIAGAPRDAQDKPQAPVILRRVRIQRLPPGKPGDTSACEEFTSSPVAAGAESGAGSRLF